MGPSLRLIFWSTGWLREWRNLFVRPTKGGSRFLPLAAVLLLHGCFRSCDCDDVVHARKLSPSGKMQAALVIPECGATVGYYTYLMVDKSGRLRPEEPEKRAVSIQGWQPDLGFSWKDDRTLVVTRLGGPLIELRKKVGAVNVVWEQPQ